MAQGGSGGREHLPIPDRPHIGLVTYDAKDPDTSFPPIEPLRPPDGAPNVLVVLIDDCGVRGLQRLRRPDQHPHGRAAGRPGPEVQPVPHHRVVLADPGGVVVGPQPPHGGDGWRHRDRDLGAGL